MLCDLLVEDSEVGLDADEEDGDGCDEEDSVWFVVADDLGAGPGTGGCPIVHVIKDSKPTSH